jgi:hypothetical protein
MQQIVLFYWQLILLRAMPGRAPRSVEFLILVGAIYAGVLAISLTVVARTSFSTTLGIIVLTVFVETFCTWLLLVYKSVSERLVVTLAALFGTSAMMNALALVPVLLLVSMSRQSLIDGVQLLFFFWWLAVAGFIFKQALNISIVQGVAIAFAMQLLTLIARNTLFAFGT